MGNPRLPPAKAKISGAAIVNPGRHKDRKPAKRTRPLGEPFAKMTPEQCGAWEEFRAELPWLNSSHRAILQLACVLRSRLDNDPETGVNALQTYSSVLSKLAATPVDESKVGGGHDDEEDETDKFFH